MKTDSTALRNRVRSGAAKHYARSRTQSQQKVVLKWHTLLTKENNSGEGGRRRAGWGTRKTASVPPMWRPGSVRITRLGWMVLSKPTNASKPKHNCFLPFHCCSHVMSEQYVNARGFAGGRGVLRRQTGKR